LKMRSVSLSTSHATAPARGARRLIGKYTP